MQRTQRLITILTAVTCLLLGSALAGAQGMHGGRAEHENGRYTSNGDHYAGGDRTIAAAALEPIGAATGWGRVVVMDLADEETTARVVVVHLFDMEPETSYELWIDGLFIASPVSDANGDAWARLSTFDDADAAPPADLPAADALGSAEVVDSSSAPVLRGDFALMIQGGGGNAQASYMERTVLDAVSDPLMHGMARVLRSVDDEQLFQSRAAGLEPGTAYHVTVDGVLAGVVTADSIGHGWLELATGSETSPLPVELQPIEDLRQVQWSSSGGELLLSGSFAGVNMVGQGDGGHGGHGGNGGNGGGTGGNGGGGGGGGNGDGECDGSGGGGRP